jgi:gliding motility-associated-like protein
MILFSNGLNLKWRSYLVIIVLFLFSENLSAQVRFQEVIGEANDDRGRSIRHTSDNGFIIIGSTYSFGAGGMDTYLVKINSNGLIAWSKTFGGVLEDDGRGLCEISSGGYALVGSTNSFGAGLNDLYLFKTDVTGTLIWSTAIGGTGDDYGFIVEETSDGGLIMVGHTSSYGAGGNDVYLVKTNANGTVLWTKTFGGNGDDRRFSVVQTIDGGYAIGGYTTSYGAGGADVYLIKTDMNGDEQWTKTFGGLYDDQGFSIAQSSDKGYILTGFANKGDVTTIDNDIYLIKTDEAGTLTWSKTFGGTQDDEGNVVRQTSDGGYAVFGFEASLGFGLYDACLLKTDANGNPVFTKAFGGTDDDLAISGHYLADNTYALAGFSASSGAGSFDVFVVKTDASGNTNNNCNEQSISFPTIFTTTQGSGFVQSSGYTSLAPTTASSVPIDKFLQMCPPCSDLAVGHSAGFNTPGTASLYVDSIDGVYNWYDDSLGNDLVFTGTHFVTPVLANATTYYVEHVVPNMISCGRTAVKAYPIIEFFIPNLVTPNNDGKNDSFYILGLPDHSALKIYNRWGEQLYESDFYTNVWNGANLSDGIYYYDLKLESEKTYKGWLQLLR